MRSAPARELFGFRLFDSASCFVWDCFELEIIGIYRVKPDCLIIGSADRGGNSALRYRAEALDRVAGSVLPLSAVWHIFVCLRNNNTEYACGRRSDGSIRKEY